MMGGRMRSQIFICFLVITKSIGKGVDQEYTSLVNSSHFVQCCFDVLLQLKHKEP